MNKVRGYLAFGGAACGLMLGACSTPTGIVPIGEGVYMSSKMDYMAWSSGKIKADLFTEASEFCRKRNQRSVPLRSTGEDATIAGRYASAEVQFRCE